MGFEDYTTSTSTPKAYVEFQASGYEVEQKNGQYYVNLNGSKVAIKPWDTVWTVKSRQLLENKSNKKDNDINSDKKFKDLKAEFNQYCEDFDNSMSLLKRTRRQFNSFLSQNHASTLSDLKGTEAYIQGKQLNDAKSLARATELQALAHVLSVNNEIQSYCSNKIMYNA